MTDNQSTRAARRRAASEQAQSRKALIQVAVFLVVISVVFTVFVHSFTTGKLDVQHISDATYTCEERIASHFGDRIQNRYYDERSSFFDEEEERYIVFYRVDARIEHGDPYAIHEYLVKCTVTETLGLLIDFEFYDHGSTTGA